MMFTVHGSLRKKRYTALAMPIIKSRENKTLACEFGDFAEARGHFPGPDLFWFWPQSPARGSACGSVSTQPFPPSPSPPPSLAGPGQFAERPTRRSARLPWRGWSLAAGSTLIGSAGRFWVSPTVFGQFWFFYRGFARLPLG